MRSSSVIASVALVAWLPFAAVVHAQQGAAATGSVQGAVAPAPPVQPNAAGQAASTQGMQAPMGGREFGSHVSGMSPDHPQMHGSMFGECVSEMAIAGVCPHHDDEY